MPGCGYANIGSAPSPIVDSCEDIPSMCSPQSPSTIDSNGIAGGGSFGLLNGDQWWEDSAFTANTNYFCDATGCWRDAATDVSGTWQDPAVYISLTGGGVLTRLLPLSSMIVGGTSACAAEAQECVANIEQAANTVLGSNPDAGITVLGYTEDLTFYEGVDVNMLQNEPDYSWEGTNVPFLEQAMARGDVIVYVSDYLADTSRTFFQEVQYITNSGYPNVIDMFQH